MNRSPLLNGGFAQLAATASALEGALALLRRVAMQDGALPPGFAWDVDAATSAVEGAQALLRRCGCDARRYSPVEREQLLDLMAAAKDSLELGMRAAGIEVPR